MTRAWMEKSEATRGAGTSTRDVMMCVFGDNGQSGVLLILVRRTCPKQHGVVQHQGKVEGA